MGRLWFPCSRARDNSRLGLAVESAFIAAPDAPSVRWLRSPSQDDPKAVQRLRRVSGARSVSNGRATCGFVQEVGLPLPTAVDGPLALGPTRLDFPLVWKIAPAQLSRSSVLTEVTAARLPMVADLALGRPPPILPP